jgi:hypothetical protein
MVSVPKLQMKHLLIELRILFIMLAGSMMFDMLDPAFLMLTSPNTMMYRIASLSHYREWVIASYIVSALLVVPYLAMHLFSSWHRRSREVTKLAIAGLLVSSVVWAFLCFISWRVETGWATLLYLRNIIGSLMFAGFLGAMLNSELRREALKEIERAVAEQQLISKLSVPRISKKDQHDVQQNTEFLEQPGA